MNSNNEAIKRRLMESSEIKALMSKDSELISAIGEAVDCIVSAYQNGGKVLFCGNGGSAADAQHLAAELSGKFYLDRAPLDAEALHVNTSYVTAVANDYSFEDVFSRAVEGKGKEGDVLVAISTSGNSNNVIKAIKSAKSKGMKVIGMSVAMVEGCVLCVISCCECHLLTLQGSRKVILQLATLFVS